MTSLPRRARTGSTSSPPYGWLIRNPTTASGRLLRSNGSRSPYERDRCLRPEVAPQCFCNGRRWLPTCAPIGIGLGWLIGRQFSTGLAVLVAIAFTIAWLYDAGILISHGLSSNCTNCHKGGWAFLIFAPATTVGFVVGLIPGIVIGRRAVRSA